jgi:taurine dioxygenase
MTILDENRPQVLDDLVIRPLQPTIGAEISGVDLRQPLGEEVRDRIRAALLEHKVVFFRDQHIDRRQHEAFAAQFGPLYIHPDARKPDDRLAAVHRISAEDSRDFFSALREEQKEKDYRDGYHTDTSWRLVPTWGAVLRAVDLPEIGGDTVWVDAGLAYEALADDIKERLAGVHIAHNYRAALNHSGHDYPVVAHPIVKTHRETGRKILWADFTERPILIGLDVAESDELLEHVLVQYRKPEHQVRFSWRPGSVAFWDNRATVHYAVRDYGDYPRLHERILIAEDPLYADPVTNL